MSNNLTLNEKNQFLDQAGVLTLIEWIRNRGVVIEEIGNAAGQDTPDYSQLTNGQVYIYNNAIYKYDTSVGTTEAEHFICLSGSATFKQDLLATVSVGVHSLPSGQGSQTLALEGKTLDEAFDYLYSMEQDPTVTQPSLGAVAITIDPNNTYNDVVLNNGREVEAGMYIKSIAYNSIAAKFNKGKYSYGPDTAVQITSQSVQVKKNGILVGTALTTDTGVFSYEDELQVMDNDVYTIETTVQHSAGATPKTNKGNDRSNLAIAAGSKSSTSATITAFRCMFYGNVNHDMFDDIQRGYGNIRYNIVDGNYEWGGSGTHEKAAKKDVVITAFPDYIGTNDGIKAMIVALPVSLGGEVKRVLLETTQNLDITNEWEEIDNINIWGANASNDNRNEAPYRIWIWKPATFQGNERVRVTIG